MQKTREARGVSQAIALHSSALATALRTHRELKRVLELVTSLLDFGDLGLAESLYGLEVLLDAAHNACIHKRGLSNDKHTRHQTKAL